MRKITEMQAGRFTAKIHFDCEYREYRIRVYENGIAQPDGDAFETDEQAARDTAQFILKHLFGVDAAAEANKALDAWEADAEADDARADSETEELNIRLARKFGWNGPDTEAEEARADMIYENVRAYLIRRRAVYKDGLEGIVSIIERDYPQDMPARDCRDDLLTFAPLDWMSVEIETVPIIGRPSDSHFSYTPDGDVI